MDNSQSLLLLKRQLEVFLNKNFEVLSGGDAAILIEDAISDLERRIQYAQECERQD